MKARIIGALLAPAFALGMAACTVDQTQEGEAPEIEVREGQMPEYNVEPADGDLNWDTTTVRTPDIDINARDTTAVRDTIR
jgi:hypothetical protein